MPKLLLRKHEFLLSQSKCISKMYDKYMKEITKLDEEECGALTNLAVFPLHFLEVNDALPLSLIIFYHVWFELTNQIAQVEVSESLIL